MGERFPVTAVTPVTEAHVRPCEAVCGAFSGWAGEVPTTGEIGHVRRLWANSPKTTIGDKTVQGAGAGERPPLKKTAIITARMTPENKQEIENRASDAGMTVTDYLTTCALGKKIVQVDGLDTVPAELKAQGRNLNQLTVLANMGQVTIVRGDELADSYAYLYDEIYHPAQEVR